MNLKHTFDEVGLFLIVNGQEMHPQVLAFAECLWIRGFNPDIVDDDILLCQRMRREDIYIIYNYKCT